MTEEEQQHVIQWGLKAKTLLEDDRFNELYMFIQNQLNSAIMSSSLKDKDFREDMFTEYAGLRSFIHRLADLAKASQDILEARDIDFETELQETY